MHCFSVPDTVAKLPSLILVAKHLINIYIAHEGGLCMAVCSALLFNIYTTSLCMAVRSALLFNVYIYHKINDLDQTNVSCADEILN